MFVYLLICISDKPKRRSKKRKTVEIESNDIKEVECPVVDNKVDIISSTENVRVGDDHSVVVIDLDYFSEEENVFNEWLQSCEQTDSVVMNDRFFNLLNLFTDCVTSNNNSESEVFKCNIDDKMRNVDIDELFESQRMKTCEGNRANTSCANEQWRNIGEQLSPVITCRQNRMVDNNIPSVSLPNRKRVYDECESESDHEDLFKSHRFNGRHDEPIDMKNSVRTSPMAFGSFPGSGSAFEVAEDDKKIDFNGIFESSSADVGDDVGEPQFFRSVGDNLRPDEVGRNDADIMGADGSEEDAGDEVEFTAEDVNFEDLFKSQRADKYIEKYNDKIVGERLDDDSDGWTCDDRTSPVIGPELGRQRETKDGRRTERRSTDGVNTPPGSVQDFDGTPTADGRPEDAEKTAVREKVDDDDADDSPEFFSWRMSTKRVRTEVAENCRPPVDLSTPPSSQSRDLVAENVRDDDPLPSSVRAAESSTSRWSHTRDEAAGNVRGHDGLPSLGGDDDDMDFMLVDYVGDGTTEVDASARKTPPVRRTASPRRSRADEKPAAEPMRPDAAVRSQPYDGGSVPLNILKACNLFKPGISLKMSTAASKRPRPPDVVAEQPRTAAVHGSAARRPVDEMSPINPPNRRQWPPRFSQSTPKVTVASVKRSPEIVAAAADTVDLLTSSSDSDVFVQDDSFGGGRNETPKARGRNVQKRRRRRKPKKVSLRCAFVAEPVFGVSIS